MSGFSSLTPGDPCCDVCNIDSLSEETAVEDADITTIRASQHPQVPYPAWVQAEVKVSVGDAARIFFAWNDSTPGDGLYAEFTPEDLPTNGTLKLFRKDGTQLGATLELIDAIADEYHWLIVSYDPDTKKATVCIDIKTAILVPACGQCISEIVPTDFTQGRKAGYGTGVSTGIVYFRNYNFRRLWYCGENPYTSDCHEFGDAWDYYYALPERIYCHSCGCGSSIDLLFGASHVTTGTVETGFRFNDNSAFIIDDADVIQINDQDRYLKHAVTVICKVGDEPYIGMQTVDGSNKVYARWTITQDIPNSTATFSATIYKVEAGGAPTAIAGPFTQLIQRSTSYITYPNTYSYCFYKIMVVCTYDEITNEIGFSWRAYWDSYKSNSTPPDPYPVISVVSRLSNVDGYIETRSPVIGTFNVEPDYVIYYEWTAKLCVCSGTAGSSVGQVHSKWPAGSIVTIGGATGILLAQVNKSHNLGLNPNTNCYHQGAKSNLQYIVGYYPNIAGITVTATVTYDNILNKSTLRVSFTASHEGYGDTAWFESILDGELDPRQLDHDVPLDDWAQLAHDWDFSAATCHIETIHP